MKHFFELLADLLYPPRCLFCDEIVPLNEECNCKKDTELKLRIKGKDRFVRVRSGRNSKNIDGLCASFLYKDEIRESVLRYKFRVRTDLANHMARYMAQDFSEAFPDVSNALVVPVPSYKKRNEHAYILSREFAKLTGFTYDEKLLVKVRKTKKQHELSKTLRAQNLKNSFEVTNARNVVGKTIIVCDDIITTGSTAAECAKTLKRQGAGKLYVCVFAASE